MIKLTKSAIIKTARYKTVDIKMNNENSAVKLAMDTAKSMGIEVIDG